MIVIPMAGASRRFTEAGYDQPKFMLRLDGDSVFAHAVSSFRRYFESTPFVFVTAQSMDQAEFVTAECRRLGVRDVTVRSVRTPTAGQAETVALGLDGTADAEPVTIFNIDTFRPGFTLPGRWFEARDGWLEVFRGGGDNWSFVRPAAGPAPIVLETAEKRPISDLCCTGLYHFRQVGDFRSALAAERRAPQAAELYVAPLYNHLIRSGASIGYRLISRDEVVFCGTPAEYDALKASPRAPE